MKQSKKQKQVEKLKEGNESRAECIMMAIVALIFSSILGATGGLTLGISMKLNGGFYFQMIKGIIVILVFASIGKTILDAIPKQKEENESRKRCIFLSIGISLGLIGGLAFAISMGLIGGYRFQLIKGITVIMGGMLIGISILKLFVDIEDDTE